MNPELAAAFEPILRDLGAPSGVRPDVRDQPWLEVPQTASASLWAPDGSGQGVWITLGEPFAAQVVFLADQAQEWAVEALWSLGRSTSWPPCPHHPARHPLTAVERSGRAVWACPVLGAEVNPIGAVQD